MSRFEATRGIFWDGLPHFETRSDDEDDTRAGTPLQNSAPHQREDVWPTTYDFTCNRPNTRPMPGTLRPQSRELATRAPRSQIGVNRRH
ncbi:hypothetical protein AVEN_253478-1 [Araneus ventricosus]|uniref:Uncharacterized protein n=1 Tax=Araneus ventricosus TaxID=182803 RepID=A0A4Y2PNP5_ARAVE|nr:hypothetical protein AVEN_253478-1 [Araneus ventricosus]